MFGADPANVPGQVAALQAGDEPGAAVELPAAESVSGRYRKAWWLPPRMAIGASHSRFADGRRPKEWLRELMQKVP